MELEGAYYCSFGNCFTPEGMDIESTLCASAAVNAVAD